MNILPALKDIIIFIPVGIIGLLRYWAWLYKRALSSQWRDIKADGPLPYHTVGTAVTVKGEPVDMFQEVLEALLREGIDQVCIVFDADEDENIQMAQRFAYAHADEIDVRWRTTTKKGKRNGLMEAILMVDGMDIIMCIDSDTVLGPGVKQAILESFSDPEIGGVTVAQRVYQPRLLPHYLFDIRLKLRYLEDLPGQALDGYVSCLSGRCSAYLAEPLKEVAPGLPRERWLGIRKEGGGDDKFLTTAIHDLGYKSAVITDAVVYTRGEDDLRTYLAQSLRWARNTWFSDLRALLTRRWMWRSRRLWFYTVDRMISTFTMLLAIWFMAALLLTHTWTGALILFLWWLFTRTIKIWPYLWETKKFHMLIPYLVMTLVIALLKVHALITLWEGSWLTRGARRTKSFLKQTRKYAYTGMTASLVVGFGVLVFVASDIWLADIPVVAELGHFYRPEDSGLLIEDDIVVDSTLVVLPENPDNATLETAVETALRLNEEFAETEGTVDVIWANELTGAQTASADLLFIGIPTANTPVAQQVRDLFQNPQLGDRLADAEPFTAQDAAPIRVVPSPWNKERQLILVGVDDAQMKYRLKGRTVDAQQAREMIVSNLGPQFLVDTTLFSAEDAAALSGWDVRDTSQMPDGTLSRTYGLTVPPGIRIGEPSVILVRLPQSTLPPGTVISLFVNEAEIGTLNVDEASEQPMAFSLPVNDINERLYQPGSNRLMSITVRVRLGQSDPAAQEALLTAREVWQQVDHNVAVQLSVVPMTPSLATFPFPFTYSPEAKPVTIIIPQEVRSADIRLAMLLSAYIGASTPEYPTIQIFRAFEVDTDSFNTSNVIILGEQGRQPLAEMIVTQVQEATEINLYNLLPNDSTGMLYMLPSPWNPQYTILLATSEVQAGYEYAATALMEQQPLVITVSHLAFVNSALMVSPMTRIDQVILAGQSTTAEDQLITPTSTGTSTITPTASETIWATVTLTSTPRPTETSSISPTNTRRPSQPDTPLPPTDTPLPPTNTPVPPPPDTPLPTSTPVPPTATPPPTNTLIPATATPPPPTNTLAPSTATLLPQPTNTLIQPTATPAS